MKPASKKRSVRMRRKTSLRSAILKKALLKARQWVDKIGLPIGTCIGCKHSQRLGYGKGRTLCVKFHVKAKLEPPNRAHAVRKTISVQHNKRKYVVKTDVVEVGVPKLQAYPVVESMVDGAGHEYGSPTCVLQAKESGAKTLLTAGHLFSIGALNPGSTYSAQLAGQNVGDVWATVSNQLSSGWLIDFAAVDIDPANYPAALQQFPWADLDSYFPDDQLDTYPDGYPGTGLLEAVLFGQHTKTKVQLDSVITQSQTVNTSNDGQYVLAPPIYHYRCLDAATKPGDSGSPVIVYDETEQATSNILLGVHVAGYTDGNGVGWGWAVPMEKVIEVINGRSGMTYNVVPA